MAITNIHPVTSTVSLCLNYIKRDKFQLHDDKMVRHKTLTSYLNCVENNAFQVFEKQRQYYKDCGRSYKKRLDGKENLAFHMVQSFDKKVDPKLANEIGKRLAEEILFEYSCVVSTHSNSDYTHNHFVFNAFKMDGSGKWNDCDKTKDMIRKTSDRLCKEYGLSVIVEQQDYNPIHWVDKNGKKRSYEVSARKDKLRESNISSSHNSYDMIHTKIVHSKNKDDSFSEKIKSDIDNTLNSVSSYSELLLLLNKQGYKINSKKKNGEWLKYVSFLSPGGEKPIRDSTLGYEYSRERLSERITEISVNRKLTSKTDSPLVNYIQDDITEKSKNIELLNNQKRNSKSNRKIEYLKNCISANITSLNVMDKYRISSLGVFENRMISVSNSLSNLNSRLSAIQKEILKQSGIYSVDKHYWTYETELYRLQRKYGLLHNFFNDCYGCISNIQRVDRENRNIFGTEIKSIGLLSSAGIVNIQHKQALVSGILNHGSITESEYPLCKNIAVTPLSTITKMRDDPDYAAAKAGDPYAAFRFVRGVFNSKDHQRKIRELGRKYPDAIIVGVLAEEASGKNKIPYALVQHVSALTGIEYDYNIMQINKVGRTGSGAAYRLANRPKFAGEVQAGRKYILTDDVITAGGTLSELRYYIESKGGEVVHIVTGAAAKDSTVFALSDKTRIALESKYGIIALKNFMKDCDIYGGKLEYLTESEGDYLLHFKSLDTARDRIFSERNSRYIQDLGRIK